jgi:hypothetical protein
MILVHLAVYALFYCVFRGKLKIDLKLVFTLF